MMILTSTEFVLNVSLRGGAQFGSVVAVLRINLVMHSGDGYPKVLVTYLRNRSLLNV